MEPIKITQEPINLYDFKIRNRDHERQAITEIQSQILKWIKDRGIVSQIKSIRSNSILLNKLTYYIANELEEKNPSLVISRGWYKYGPCYDQGRQGEESLTLTLFDYLHPSETILTEVDENCEKEIPLFLETFKKNQNYPSDYLKHIYNDRVDYKEIKGFYLAKHNLADCAWQCQNEPSEKNLEKLNEFTMIFDTEIVVSPYCNIVGIRPNNVDLVLEFTALMNQILNDLYENTTEYNQNFAYNIINEFINTVLMVFANKNYIYTLKTSNDRHKKFMEKNAVKAYNDYIDKTKTIVTQYYQILNN